MRRQGLLTALLVTLALAGCGGGDEDSIPSPSTIKAFTVTGTNGINSASGQAVAIAPSQNGGLFGLDWTASSSTKPYRADFYVSPDATLSSNDQAFFGRNCDQPVGDCQSQVASFDCAFGSDVKLTCPAGSAETMDLSTWFASNGGLPNSYYVILRVCDGLFTDCVTRAVPVTFQ